MLTNAILVKSAMEKYHIKDMEVVPVSNVQTVIHKASLGWMKSAFDAAQSYLPAIKAGIKAVDTAVDIARLARHPEDRKALTKAALGVAHIGEMAVGAALGSSYAHPISLALHGGHVLSEAAKVASGDVTPWEAVKSIGLPTVYALGAPVMATALGKYAVPATTIISGVIALQAGVSMISNAYSLYNEKPALEVLEPSDKNSLHAAVYNGNLAVIKEKGTKDNLNSFDKQNLTPLAIAILQNKPEEVRALVELGSDVKLSNGAHGTALHLAVNSHKHPNKAIIDDLLKAGAVPSKEDMAKYPQYLGKEVIIKLLQEAIDNNDKNRVKILLEPRKNQLEGVIDPNGGTLLSYAVEKNRHEIAVYLIKNGFQPEQSPDDMRWGGAHRTQTQVAELIGGETLAMVKDLGRKLKDTGAENSDSKDAIPIRARLPKSVVSIGK